MKKFYLLIIFFISFIFVGNVDAKEINMYLFYGEGCPHCEALMHYLNSEYSHNKDINLYKYEVWNNTKNQSLWEEVQKAVDVDARGVPYFVVGDEVVQGYNDTPAFERKIDSVIEDAKTNKFNDNAGIALGIVDGKIKPKNDEDKKEENNKKQQEDNKKENKEENKKIDIPIIGETDISNLSLPVIAGLIGIVDGFNPCAMWVLIFLIALLLDYPSRKKMWILGSTFLLTSAVVYYVFMFTALKATEFASAKPILNLLIALFALIFGGYNIYRYFKLKKENASCDIVNKDKRKKIMTYTKKALSNEYFVLSLIGIIILAISVNLIDALCSMGLPVMFTEILAYNNITGSLKFIYLLIYIIFFMLDDFIIFFIAMKTLKIKAISNKYSKYSHLIGGIIMLIIGVLMVLKPEWLMFNF